MDEQADGFSVRCLGKSLVFRPHLREEEHILDGWRIGHDHRQTVDPDAQPCGGRHAEFKGPEEILIEYHRLVITSFAQLQLRFKPFALVDGIV